MKFSIREVALTLSVAASMELGAAVCSPGAAAQVPDSVSMLISSHDRAERASGVAWLLSIPANQWTTSIRDQVTSLVNQEGERSIDPAIVESDTGEAAGHYEIDLVRAAVRLADPASLPGLVYLGLRVSPQAKSFIVSRGGEALPLLQRAYTSDEELKVPSVQTVGLILSSMGDRISDQDRLLAYRMLLKATPYELSFLRNAGLFPELSGVLSYAADSSSDEAERARAIQRLPYFRSKLSTFSPLDLLRRERQLLSAICDGREAGHCESIKNLLANVEGHVTAKRWGPARNTIDAVLQQLAQGCGQDEFSPNACRAMIENARQLRQKVS